MGNHIPFIVPAVNVTILKTELQLRDIGSHHTQVRKKRKRLVVHLAKTAFVERITGKLLSGSLNDTQGLPCLLQNPHHCFQLLLRTFRTYGPTIAFALQEWLMKGMLLAWP